MKPSLLNYTGEWTAGGYVSEDGFEVPRKHLWSFVTRFTYMMMLSNIPGPSGRSITSRREKLPKGLVLGCDWGHCWPVFENCFEEVHGLEIKEWAVEQGVGLGRNIVCGTVDDIPFEDEFFDVVMSRHVLPYSKDVYAALCGVLRVTKPGGWSLHNMVCTRDGVAPIPGLESLYNCHLSYSEWEAMFVECGFNIVSSYFGWSTNIEDYIIVVRRPK